MDSTKGGNMGSETINHPQHYGGDTVYEAIKVIEAWGLGFCLGNTIKYICRSGKKGSTVEDLKKAAWYLNREIQRIQKEQSNGNQMHGQDQRKDDSEHGRRLHGVRRSEGKHKRTRSRKDSILNEDAARYSI
jgi:hypothetical protein